ncbi:hypothetical protein ACJMK2_005020 [Sinanodonta woodiana]|uniref:Uncharacterized protein n=1 Tax=Sinanodonta woodiana TaxID=1069815 RepID=A0ABD3VNT0_SINWO
MRKRLRVFFYFSIWITLALVAVVLNILNIDWSQTNIANGVFIVLILSIIQGSVFEFPVQTIATLIVGGNRRENKKAPADRLTIVLNYNLLATSKDDIDECFETMYEAFIGNLGPNVSAVLVSITNDEELKKYELEKRDTKRAVIYDELFHEGILFSQGHYNMIDSQRTKTVWQIYKDVDPTVFVSEYLDDICDKYTREFMVLHRVSRVVRKCGQYQDLMLLSEGESEAYSYCDPEYYGTNARPYGQPLFHASNDVSNVFERKFDYTLVLDADTRVPSGAVSELLEIAAAHPDSGIIQPAIYLNCKSDDTIFMHLESMRQGIFEPMTNAITALLGQSGFFGKGLIKNRVYIDKVIGTKDKLIERVSVDVLSHDTFEAAILQPLYAGSVYLLEAPSYNYITWHIRERRWNRGEILLAMYFWPNAFGRPMRFLQKVFQRKSFIMTQVRTPSKLDFVSSYIAHSALRQMFMKPLLLLFIILHINIQLRYQYVSIIIVMFIVLVFPKFATCNRKNFKGVFLETIASICQFTPEALVGTFRICWSLADNISPNVKWIPQRAVEEELKVSNPFVASLKHLWGYSLFALIASILVGLFIKQAFLAVIMFGTLFLLPFFTGFTSLSPNFKCRYRKQTQERYIENVEDGLQIMSRAGKFRSLGSLTGSSFMYNPELYYESQ